MYKSWHVCVCVIVCYCVCVGTCISAHKLATGRKQREKTNLCNVQAENNANDALRWENCITCWVNLPLTLSPARLTLPTIPHSGMPQSCMYVATQSFYTPSGRVCECEEQPTPCTLILISPAFFSSNDQRNLLRCGQKLSPWWTMSYPKSKRVSLKSRHTWL